jgi:hypothetical protein
MIAVRRFEQLEAAEKRGVVGTPGLLRDGCWEVYGPTGGGSKNE